MDSNSPDLARIKRNVAKMASMNAPVEDIDGYIASEGVSVDQVKAFKHQAAPAQPPLSRMENYRNAVTNRLTSAGTGLIGLGADMFLPDKLPGQPEGVPGPRDAVKGLASAARATPVANAPTQPGVERWIGDNITGNPAMFIGGPAVAAGGASVGLDSVLKSDPALPFTGKLAEGGKGTVIGATTAYGFNKLAQPLMDKAGKAIAGHATARAAARKADFVQDLVTPKLTPTVRADQFSRSTEQGVLRSRVVQPSPMEKQVMDTVAELPVSKGKSLTKNYNIIADANRKEAQRLAGAIKGNDAPVDLGTVQQAFNSTMTNLRKNAFLSGDGEAAAVKVADMMSDAILKNADDAGNITASGLLQARKDFDAAIRAQRPKLFDASVEGPVSTAVSGFRQSINDLVGNTVPSAQVRQSLTKQSNLYRAMDAIETKGGYEGQNMLRRAADKVAEKIPGKSGLTKTVLGTLGFGAATQSPALAAAGIGGYGLLKGATSPATEKAAGLLVQGAGRMPLPPGLMGMLLTQQLNHREQRSKSTP